MCLELDPLFEPDYVPVWNVMIKCISNIDEVETICLI